MAGHQARGSMMGRSKNVKSWSVTGGGKLLGHIFGGCILLFIPPSLFPPPSFRPPSFSPTPPLLFTCLPVYRLLLDGYFCHHDALPHQRVRSERAKEQCPEISKAHGSKWTFPLSCTSQAFPQTNGNSPLWFDSEWSAKGWWFEYLVFRWGAILEGLWKPWEMGYMEEVGSGCGRVLQGTSSLASYLGLCFLVSYLCCLFPPLWCAVQAHRVQWPRAKPLKLMSQSKPILPWTVPVSFLVTTIESDKTRTHTFSYKSKSGSFEKHYIIWIYHIHYISQIVVWNTSHQQGEYYWCFSPLSGLLMRSPICHIVPLFYRSWASTSNLQFCCVLFWLLQCFHLGLDMDMLYASYPGLNGCFLPGSYDSPLRSFSWRPMVPLMEPLMPLMFPSYVLVPFDIPWENSLAAPSAFVVCVCVQESVWCPFSKVSACWIFLALGLNL